MITVTTRVQLECDHGPNLCLRQPTVISAHSTFDAYNEARVAGWYICGSRCLCPKHASERDLLFEQSASGVASPEIETLNTQHRESET